MSMTHSQTKELILLVFLDGTLCIIVLNADTHRLTDRKTLRKTDPQIYRNTDSQIQELCPRQWRSEDSLKRGLKQCLRTFFIVKKISVTIQFFYTNIDHSLKIS